MENNKKVKTKKIIIAIITIIPILLGVSFAYFQARILGNTSRVTGKASDFIINLVTENDGYINATDLLLIESTEVEEKSQKGFFKVVTGNNDHYVTYSLALTELTITANLRVSDFKWQLICLTDSSNNASGTFQGVSANNMTFTSNIRIGPNQTDEYELRIWLEENNTDQISLLNGSFRGKVTLIASMEYNPALPTLANYIIELASDSVNTRVYNEPATDYRYQGLNPNNYISFNNETWRIIGIFADNTHGKTGQKLVKIIRSDTTESVAWNSGGENNWQTSSLKTYLNSEYYNSIDSTYRNLIENVTWKVGGVSAASTLSTEYAAERGTNVFLGRPTTVSGYIGLMYPSDYGYAALASACSRTTNLIVYSNYGCCDTSWLFSESHDWTLSPDTTSANYVYTIFADGSVYPEHSAFTDRDYETTMTYRPSLYLKSSTKIVGGDGSYGNPYIIE